MKPEIARSASPSTLPSTYDAFLYATVGESTNGAPLTVLSLLARQDLDPWVESADLSLVSHDCAARRLAAMIAVSTGESSPAGEAAIAERLVALLPRRVAAVGGAPGVSHGGSFRSPPGINLTVIAIYIGVMALTQWVAAGIFEKPPTHAASAPPQSTPAEMQRATSGETDQSPR